MNHLSLFTGAMLMFVNSISTCGQANGVHYDTIREEIVIVYHEDSFVHKTYVGPRIFSNDSATRESQNRIYHRIFASLLGIPILSEHVSGECMRIWNWDFGHQFMIEFKQDGTSFNSHIIEFEGKKIDSTTHMLILKEWRGVCPKSGWERFFLLAKEYEIFSLKSTRSELVRKYDCTGGAYITVEAVQSNTYRFYEHLEPSYYRYVDTGSQKVYEFLKKVNEEMNIKVYDPGDNLFLKP